MRRAMELSVLCDCDVAVIVYDSRGRLYQFSSGSMDTILSRYSRTCTEPHESHTTEDVSGGRCGATCCLQRISQGCAAHPAFTDAFNGRDGAWEFWCH